MPGTTWAFELGGGNGLKEGFMTASTHERFSNQKDNKKLCRNIKWPLRKELCFEYKGRITASLSWREFADQGKRHTSYARELTTTRVKGLRWCGRCRRPRSQAQLIPNNSNKQPFLAVLRILRIMNRPGGNRDLSTVGQERI